MLIQLHPVMLNNEGGLYVTEIIIDTSKCMFQPVITEGNPPEQILASKSCVIIDTFQNPTFCREDYDDIVRCLQLHGELITVCNAEGISIERGPLESPADPGLTVLQDTDPQSLGLGVADNAAQESLHPYAGGSVGEI